MADIFEISIPENLENMQLPAPELITFYKNLDNRILWLDSDVDDHYMEYARHIMQWNQDDHAFPVESRIPIKLLFFSDGGDLSVNNALIDVIKLSQTPVYGYNMGNCASAACFIFLSCHKRYALPSASFLLHRGSAENISGTYEQVVAYVVEYQRKIDELGEFILDNTTIDRETLNDNLGGEWYISAKEACEDYGMVDAIVTSLDDIML